MFNFACKYNYKMTDSKDILFEFGRKNNFQYPDLDVETLSITQLEMLKDQDLDMYNIFGFEDSSGVSRDDISNYYDSLIQKLGS